MKIHATVSAIASAAVLAMACGCGAATQAAPTRSTSPSPTPIVLTTAGLCRTLFPDMEKAQKQVQIFLKHPDGSKTNQATLSNVIESLEHDEEVAPADLKPKIAAVRKPLADWRTALQTQTNREINFEDYRSVGVDLATICEDKLWPAASLPPVVVDDGTPWSAWANGSTYGAENANELLIEAVDYDRVVVLPADAAGATVPTLTAPREVTLVCADVEAGWAFMRIWGFWMDIVAFVC